jgi:photosystem II stability/assembly factor-like uncharacterized protein
MTIMCDLLRNKRERRLCTLALLGVVAAACSSGAADETYGAPFLSRQTSGTSFRLQAISAVDDKVVWTSGLGGTFARTTDGGDTWASSIVPAADSLQFRDVEAFDANTAYLLSAGAGPLSRIYKTTDGGETWSLQFTNEEPAGFFDCMAFWDPANGMAFSDAVDGEIVVIRTTDGETWQRVPAELVPDASSGEGSFAASGTCLITNGDSTAWFGTGASETARVFKTTDRGHTWSVAETPIVSGTMAGIASLAFADQLTGMAAGGDMSSPDAHGDNMAVTADGGLTWTLAGRPVFTGAIYGLATTMNDDESVLFAVGPGGLDYSLDNGMVWFSLDTLDYWSVAFGSPTVGWAVGPEGRTTKIEFRVR